MPVWISRFWEALRKEPPGLSIPCVDLQFLSQSAMGPLGPNFARSGGSWRLLEGLLEAPWRQTAGWMEAGWRQAGGKLEPGWRQLQPGLIYQTPQGRQRKTGWLRLEKLPRTCKSIEIPPVLQAKAETRRSLTKQNC